MNKIVLIGAGSTQFGLGTIGDIFKSKILEGSTIVLHDINPEALDNTKKISEKYKEELGVKCNKRPQQILTKLFKMQIFV
jgi:Alpha-galactosidases/6-phospho-beta-glucosidases, family 4 of glycosyl hydrolases